MQQWPASMASRPRCHSDPVDSPSSLLSFGDFDGFERSFERSASETLWEDNRNVAPGSCMFTALSQAIASVSCQPHPRLCSDNLSPSSTSSTSSISFMPPSSSSSSMKPSPGSSAPPCQQQQNFPTSSTTTLTNHLHDTSETILPMIPTTLADVFCSAASSSISTASSDHEQSEDATSRGSPDSRYAISPRLTPDTTLFDQAGSPSGDNTPGRPKRRPYSKLQLMHLEQEFQQSMYPCRERRAWLSQLLSLSERQVKIWFQNRRTKLKRSVEREKKEHEQMQRDMATLAMQFYAPPAVQQ